MLKKTIGILLCLAMLTTMVATVAVAEDKVQLKLMLNLIASDKAYPYYMQIVEDYNVNNDLNVEIVPEFYENEQYKTKFVTLMASNNVPDIFFTYELDYLRPFVEAGRVADLTSYFDNDPEWKASFSGGTLETLTYDSKIYAVPTQKTMCEMFYNKGIFKANGVEVPTTFDEFLAVCETLKAAGIIPMAMSGTDAWIPAQMVQQISNGIGGMDLYYGICEGERQWNDPCHIQAGQEMQKMVENGYYQSGFLGMKPEESRQLFLDGKTAMYFMGDWDSVNVYSALGEDAGAFILPPINAEYANVTVGSVDTSFAVAENCKYKDEAVDFLKYWTSETVEQNLLYGAGRMFAGAYTFDESKLTPMAARILELSSEQVGLTPWWDRAFGAGEGVEFNNICVAICGGEDVQASFDALQQFAIDNAEK